MKEIHGRNCKVKKFHILLHIDRWSPVWVATAVPDEVVVLSSSSYGQLQSINVSHRCRNPRTPVEGTTSCPVGPPLTTPVPVPVPVVVTTPGPDPGPGPVSPRVDGVVVMGVVVMGVVAVGEAGTYVALRDRNTSMTTKRMAI